MSDILQDEQATLVPARFEFTVKRSEWRRGTGPGPLFNPETGNRSRLGFVGNAIGVCEPDMASIFSFAASLNGQAELQSLSGEYTPAIESQFKPFSFLSARTADPDGLSEYTSSGIAKCIMDVNDNPYMSDEQRESRLLQLFAANNVTIKFID